MQVVSSKIVDRSRMISQTIEDDLIELMKRIS